MTAALSITVDVDGTAGLPDGGAGHEHRLTALSERAFGVDRGLPRILAALDEVGASATFYVPGVTAVRHRDAIAALAATRHEVGHHGNTHRRPDLLAPAEQQREIAEGAEALADVTGRPPEGYRAPGWELTPATLAALDDSGFRFDSSLMGDDRPYAIAGSRLVELPVQWALDDAPHFARATDTEGLESTWLAALRAATREERHTTLTCHPEILGHAHRIDVLRRVLEAAASAGVPCVTHGQVADAWLGRA